MKKQLIISTSVELVRIAPERIVYISSDGNYSTIVQTDGELRLVSLHVGRMDKTDTTVVFTTQAADVRADNGGIVGAFVLAGKPLSWGLSKKGYCASIDGVVTVGAVIACRKTPATWSGEKSKSGIRKTGIPTKTII